MRRRAPGSLGRRLSWWLAFETLVGLGAVCAAVYVAFAMSLSARQAETLTQKQALIRHLLEEASTHHDLHELKHRLDDFLMGHTDMGLVLQAGNNPPLYRSAKIPASDSTRTAAFAVPVTLEGITPINATLTVDLRPDEQLLWRLALALFGAAAAGVLLVSMGGFLLVRRGLAPVRGLVEQTRRLPTDSLRHQLDGSAQPDELQPLVEQFNALLRRLDKAYEQMEGFNADVAHELCTPLATLIGASELALRRVRSIDEMREVLGSNLEDLRRLSGIVHDMLFLSHADRGAAARREAVPSLAAIAASVAEYHDAALEEARVGVKVAGDAAAEVDVALLRRALSNLIGNATRYATPGSNVRVEITVPDRHVHIVVVNQGPTIAADQLPRLFDRFFRCDSVRTTGEHHGLGLAIVAAIARMHGGRPIAHSADGITAIGLTLLQSSGPPQAAPSSSSHGVRAWVSNRKARTPEGS
ncbi:MAG: heavy metal sensor histidine kinase [Burkholderiaceae bacterium]|nr:heavy metal sensor histidine kinase [Burkholderiaceae bacterium]